MKDLNTEEVRELAKRLHTGHFRKDGVTPYFEHLERVAKKVERITFRNEKEKQIAIQAAYLHDSIEDGKTTDSKLRFEEHVDHEVVMLVKELTKDKYDDYLEYIHTLGTDASLIKIQDILDNLSDDPTDKQIKKYAKALLILMGEE